MHNRNALRFILCETRIIKFIPFDILNFCRLIKIEKWFQKQDKDFQKVLVAIINSQYEMWKRVSPIIMILGTGLTVFFSFLISFSVGIINLGSNLIMPQGSEQIPIDEIETFYDQLITDNIEAFLKVFLISILFLIILILLYYWKIGRITKVRNIINLAYDESL